LKLPLDAGFWSRLYGPYGNRSVNRSIQKLIDHWDHDCAIDLFWEELHHQDDIYPATYAALPWFVEVRPQDEKGFEELYLFLSHVIYCGCSDASARSKGTYQGLSMNLKDHHHDWLPNDQWLQESDLPTLLTLKHWFTQNVSKIAVKCLDLINDDLTRTAYALEGFSTFNGSTAVARAAHMLADGEDPNLIEEEIGAFGETDAKVVEALKPYLRNRNVQLFDFLSNFPREFTRQS